MSKQQALFDTEPDPWSLDDQADWLAARIVFSKKPFGPYDYEVPAELRGQIQIGQRVQVPLGRGNRVMEGYCVDIIGPRHSLARSVNPSRLKPLIQVLDPQPLISQNLLDLGR